MRTSAVLTSEVSTEATRAVTEPLPHAPDTMVGEGPPGTGSVGRWAEEAATAHEPTWKSYGNVAETTTVLGRRQEEHETR
jgi:hypothetical protein